MIPMIQDPLALLALISGLVALAFWLEGRFDWARKASASLFIILGGRDPLQFGVGASQFPVYGRRTVHGAGPRGLAGLEPSNLPTVMVGLLGYAVGTYVGLAMAALVRMIL